MFENLLPPKQKPAQPGALELSTNIDYDKMAQLTEGYSGSDIRLVCKEAAMSTVRKVLDVLEDKNPKEGRV